MIKIAGGIYREYCMRPHWDEIYGSAGRAASAIAAFEESVELYGYLDAQGHSWINEHAEFEGFSVYPTLVEQGVAFRYIHPLSTPLIREPVEQYPSISIEGEQVICFGMLEGQAIVEAGHAVYDPQNALTPVPFSQNGSKAKHLAVILNENEGRRLTGIKESSPQELASAVSSQSQAEVVVLKRGALGALVYHNQKFTSVPAYQTKNVWKLGSGDMFVAHFGYQWMSCGTDPAIAADMASRATAYYCQTRGFPNAKRLSAFSPSPIVASERYSNGYLPQVYLAGPFFTLAQRWLIEEARNSLIAVGFRVFSPVHDVGLGSANEVAHLDLKGLQDSDVVLAIGDGLDAGTIYEIGYARALNKPVIMYCENESEEDKKMMEGSGCTITSDFTTSIYQALWTAMSL